MATRRFILIEVVESVIPASVGVITGAALLEARLQTAFHF